MSHSTWLYLEERVTGGPTDSRAQNWFRWIFPNLRSFTILLDRIQMPAITYLGCWQQWVFISLILYIPMIILYFFSELRESVLISTCFQRYYVLNYVKNVNNCSTKFTLWQQECFVKAIMEVNKWKSLKTLLSFAHSSSLLRVRAPKINSWR